MEDCWKSVLANVVSQVLCWVDRRKSVFMNVEPDVLQGSVLVPLLLSFCSADMFSIPVNQVLGYAYDFILL